MDEVRYPIDDGQEFQAGAHFVEQSTILELEHAMIPVFGIDSRVQMHLDDLFEHAKVETNSTSIDYDLSWAFGSFPTNGGEMVRLAIKFKYPRVFELRVIFDVEQHREFLGAIAEAGEGVVFNMVRANVFRELRSRDSNQVIRGSVALVSPSITSFEHVL